MSPPIPYDNSASYPSNYDPAVVVREADAMVDSEGLEGAQMQFQSKLLDWVDDAREVEGLDSEQMRQAIAELWAAYARFNRKHNKAKAAIEAYEAAVHCPVAGNVGKTWLEYARYQEERSRHRSAQRLYLRALVGDENAPAAVRGEPDTSMLWNEFLRMMQALNNNPALTLHELREAVEKEHVAHTQQQRDNKEDEARGNDTSNILDMADDSVQKVGTDDYAAEGERARLVGASNTNTAMPPVVNRNHSVTPKGIEDASAVLLNMTQGMPSELTASWLARDGNASPSRPEPPLFSPSPPKLGDASGKDLLGVNLASTLVRLLLKRSDDDYIGSTLLEICHGCWLMTALKEKEACTALNSFDQKMTTEFDKMEADQEARLSVAGGARMAVETMNHNEKDEFFAKFTHQRQQLLDFVSWEFRQLLANQQQILTNAGLPIFDGPTVDSSTIALQSNVCSFMHSAFYLRARIGEKAHLSMLESQAQKLAAAQKANPLPPPPPPSMGHPNLPPSSSASSIYHSSMPTTQGYPQPPNFPPPPPSLPQQHFPQHYQHPPPGYGSMPQQQQPIMYGSVPLPPPMLGQGMPPQQMMQMPQNLHVIQNQPMYHPPPQAPGQQQQNPYG